MAGSGVVPASFPRNFPAFFLPQPENGPALGCRETAHSLSARQRCFARCPFFFAAELAVFLAAVCRISVRESAALNGYCRMDCCPVVLSVISTRRLLASRIVAILPRTLWRSAAVNSG